MVTKTASIRRDSRLFLWALSLLTLGTALLLARPAASQERTAAELEDLVAPVALYPDDVLGIILPASTFPLDVVRAARFLDDREDDPSLEPDPEWDDSVVALLNYPEVLRMMDENIDWTWELGEAVLTDQSAVLEAAQDFRGRALAAGNLQSDDKQTVTSTEGAITIVPADPEVVYIPIYEPRRIVVYQPTPIWYYYPYAYPVYYYPYPSGYSFSLGFFWGVTSYFSIGWHSHYVHVHHYTDYGHPYYLNSYYTYTPYYPRNHVHITVVNNNHDHVWQPSPRRGSRPDHVTVEGRDSVARVTRTASTARQSEGAPRSSSGDISRSSADGNSRSSASDSNRSNANNSSRSSAADIGTQRVASPNSSGNRSSSDNRSSGNGNSGSRAAAPGQSSVRPPQAAERTSPRPSPQASERPSPQAAERSSPQVSTRSSPQASIRPAPQTSVRPAPQTSTRSAPQATTRPAPSASTTRPAPSASTRAAPQASVARAESPGQSSPGGSARSGNSSGSRMTGATRSGADHGSSSARRSER